MLVLRGVFVKMSMAVTIALDATQVRKIKITSKSGFTVLLGYTGPNGFDCTDIDECLDSETCSDGVECHNNDGSFVCGNCAPGYYLSPHG